MTLPLRSQYRIQALTNLIAELSRRPMTVQQTADFLGMTHAGAKNYMRDLRTSGMIDAPDYRSGHVGPPAPIYHLTTNTACIAGYLAALQANEPPPSCRPVGTTLLAQCLQDPTRHLHVMVDDTHYQPPMHRVKPFRDCLVAALFGPTAGAHA